MIAAQAAPRRTRLPRRALAFIICMAVLATGCTAAALWLQPVVVAGGLVEGVPWFLGAGIALLIAAAVVFPLSFAPGHKLSVADAPLFAAVLLFAPGPSMLIAGGGALFGYAILRLLRRRRMTDLAFNSAKATLAAGIGGLVLHALLGRTVPFNFHGVGDILSLPVVAVVLNTANSLPTSIIVWLQRGRNPWRGWLAARRTAYLQTIALYLIGLVAALTSQLQPWTLAVMVLPTVPIYITLKRTVQFLEQQSDQQTVTAVEAMADTVDMRQVYTFDHSKHVAAYAVQIARQLSLPSKQVETIRLAARVHDLGKIGVPDHVLRKEGPLTPEERAQIDRHADIGYEILSRFADYRDCKELVLLHHQRWDRAGHQPGLAAAATVPAGAAGPTPQPAAAAQPATAAEETLLLSAQVIAVADALDAMTSNRPYRSAMSLEEAMTEFRRYRGQQWHPAVVDALERLVSEPDRARGLDRIRATAIPV